MIKHIILKIKKKLKITNDIKEYRKQGVLIGNNTHIFNSYLDSTHPHLIEIGNNCTLTNCTLLTHDASTNKTLGRSKIGIISVGDDCFIGWGAIILPNVNIGNNCIIGAGTVVSKDIPNNSVVVGNPCRIIKKTSDYLNKQKELMNSGICYNYNFSKMSNIEKNMQKKELKENRIGFDK